MDRAAVADFWVSSGHHLLDRGGGGGLVVTDEFLRLYLARPEVLPPEDACTVERTLHARLLAEPRTEVEPYTLHAMADPDARENWRVLLSFRDRLLAAPTLEAAYLGLVRRGAQGVPAMFLDHLVHAILRNALDGETDAFALRAAETFFRAQRLGLHDGMLLLADEETVGDPGEGSHASPLAGLFADAAARDLAILTEETAPLYAGRSDAFDLALDFRHGGPGRAAFARVVERWLAHMLALTTGVTALPRVEGHFPWFVGLDAEATRLGNALWTGEELAEEEADRLVALFRLDILDQDRVVPRLRGKPVYLLLACDGKRSVRVKPQNLLAGLPLVETSG